MVFGGVVLDFGLRVGRVVENCLDQGLIPFLVLVKQTRVHTFQHGYLVWLLLKRREPFPGGFTAASLPLKFSNSHTR